MTLRLLQKRLLALETNNCKRFMSGSKELLSDTVFPEEQQKILKVALVGPPNVGKSTIINQLLRRRIFAMSKKVHTTKCCARAVLNEGPNQIIFLDTPGLVSAKEMEKYKLSSSFFHGAEDAINQADVIGVVHDVSNRYTRDKLDPKSLRLLHLYKEKSSSLLLNKVDTLKSKRQLLDICKKITNGKLSSGREPQKLSELEIQRIIESEHYWEHFNEIFMVSALLGNGIDDFRDYLLSKANFGKWLFPPDVFTDKKPERIIEETVRSKLLEHLPKQIPYILDVQVEYLDMNEEKISSVVLVECPTDKLKLLIMGHGGSRIKTISIDANEELSDAFQKEFHLKVLLSTKKIGSKVLNAA